MAGFRHSDEEFWIYRLKGVDVRSQVEVTGMIVKSMPVSENDRRLTILTLEQGKIYVFARGARKMNSNLLGVSREFLYGKFKIYEGRYSNSLDSAKIINYFDAITKDMEKTLFGSYFLELADYYTREHIVDADTVKLLYVALLALENAHLDNKLVRRVFELRIMAMNGDFEDISNSNVSADVKYTWGFVVRTPVEKLFTFTLKKEAFEEFDYVVDSVFKKNIRIKLKALEILTMICY